MSAVVVVRRLLGGLIALAMLTSLFAAVTVSPASAGAGYQKPHKGECRNLTADQIGAHSNSTAPISCSETHTAQTIAVKKLSKKVWKNKKSALTAAGTKCNKVWDKAVGRSVKKQLASAYSLGYFIPTKAQRSHGARWFRCDIILLGGEELAPLPRTTAPFLSVPTPDSQAKCLTTKFYTTTCALPHFLRVTGVVKLKGKTYPGKAKVKKMSVKKCKSRVTTDGFYYRWPTKAEWNRGYKWVLCESETTT